MMNSVRVMIFVSVGKSSMQSLGEKVASCENDVWVEQEAKSDLPPKCGACGRGYWEEEAVGTPPPTARGEVSTGCDEVCAAVCVVVQADVATLIIRAYQQNYFKAHKIKKQFELLWIIKF